MEPIAWVTLVVALLVVVTRAPLLAAPKATLDAYRAVIATPTRVRVLSVLIGVLGAGLAATAPAVAVLHPNASAGLGLLGWLWIGGSVFLMLLPRAYQSVAEAFLLAVADETVLRVFGALGTGVGIALAWLAFEIR